MTPPSRFRLGPSGLSRLPQALPGMRIGLYGGSFNPAHPGHRHVSLMALKRLGLDRVWWIVSPGNPLKMKDELASLPARIAHARHIAHHPRIAITAFEADIGAQYTIDTLAYLRRRYPAVRFVWIMGADNLADFHRWRGWQGIAGMLPMAVIDRPGWTLKALQSRAALSLAPFRKREDQARTLSRLRPPAWIFLHGPRSSISSTQLRRMRRTSPPERR